MHCVELVEEVGNAVDFAISEVDCVFWTAFDILVGMLLVLVEDLGDFVLGKVFSRVVSLGCANVVDVVSLK